MTTLRLENVTKRVGHETHLYDLDLTLRAGELYVLFGPTLAGKTSTMRLMGSLDRPSEGRVLVDDRDVTQASVRERSVAMVYQQFINYPSFSVFDNIASPLRLKGLPRAEIEQKVRETATMLHIEGLLDRLPAALSGGQQQRVAIARALVKEAELLLLDEPLVNLDYKLREEMREEMRAIFARRSAIVVYATTEPLEALLLGGNTIILDKGRVLQVGPTLEVYQNPASVAVGEVFSDPPMNVLEGSIADGALRLADDITVPLAEHMRGLAPGRYIIGVRAHHLSLLTEVAGGVELPAQVELAEVSGSETFIHVRHGDTALVVQEEGLHTIDVDREARVFLDPRFLFVFDPAGPLVAAPEQRLAARAAE